MIGQTISHYKISAKLGAGGMGEVYLASDTRLDRQVALKFLPESLSNDPEARQRLLREAKAASKLNHPNILTVHAVEEAEGRDFIAMEYVEGRSLKDLVTRGDLDICRIIETAIQIGEGLAAAHKADVVHRDIKSDNVVVTPEGRAKIMDFGLATWRGASQLTKEGSTVGTMAYMSPEQAQGQPVDQRTDLWSLGVILYEMVTRRLPFEGDHDAAITYSIVNEMPHPLARYSADVPEELQRIVGKCLNKNRDERYQSASDLVADLRALRRFSSASGLPVARPSRKHTRLIAILSVVGVAVIAVAAALLTDLFRSSEDTVVPERKKLVILPFENLGTADKEFFADGITDEIIGKLATISELRVISRTSSMQYKGTDKSLRQIGEELGVGYVLEGTIRWDTSGGAERVRVQPQLIQVSDDTHLWVETYERPLTSIFEVQSEIAARVAEALNITMLDPERRGVESQPTENIEAYHAYLRGLSYLKGPNFEVNDGREGVTSFKRAVQLDSTFALAYARLSMTYSRIYHFGFDVSDSIITMAKAALDRAFRLDPSLPEAYLAKGSYHYCCHREYEAALEAHAEARRLMPNDADVLLAIGAIQRRQGLWNQAIETMKRAFELSPRDALLASEIGYCYLVTHRYAPAERYIDLATALAPDEGLEFVKSTLCLMMGDIQRARAALEAGSYTPTDNSWETQFLIELCDRNYQRTLGILDSIPVVCLQLQDLFTPIILLKATVYQLLGDTSSARIAYDSAHHFLECESRARPDDHRVHSSLGIAYAGLGRKEDAVREGKLGLSLFPVEKDAFIGPYRVEDLAIIHTMVGEYDQALDQLEYLLSIPAVFSVHTLQLDPRYDPLRSHPRYQALLEKGDKVF